MKTLAKFAFVLLLLISSVCCAQTATINGATTFQPIDGFGAASAFIGLTNTSVINTEYSATGIGLKYIRTNIIPDQTSCGEWSYGGCVASSGATIATADLTNVQAAVANGAVLWGSIWSPPNAMKANNNYAAGGAYNGGSTNNTNLAAIFVSWVNLMQGTYGIPVYAVSVQNEPDQSQAYPSCTWTAAQIHDFVPVLRTALDNAGLSAVKIMIAEPGHWINTYASTAMSDATVAPQVGVLASHGYSNTGSGPVNPPTLLSYSNVTTQHQWETEVGDSNTYDGTMTSGLTYAQAIHQWLTIANASAWHYWQISDAAGRGNNQGLTSSAQVLAKRAYVMGNWARFATGLTRISATANPQTNVLVTAFKNLSTGAFSIVAVNMSGGAISQPFTLAGLSATAVTPWITDGTRSLASQANITISGNAFTASLPASSVTTFVSSGGGGGSGCTLTGTNTYTPTDNSFAAVNNCINGPGHVAAAGDTINIPAGSVTWTSGVAISGVGFNVIGAGTPNSLPSQYGQGTVSTTITQNTTAALFSISNVPSGQTVHISSLNLVPQAGLTNENMPIGLSGAWTTSCPQVRVDNVNFDAAYTNDPAAADMAVNNLCGVLDHNNANGSGEGAPAALVQSSFSAWQGVGANGDNSFSAADSVGTFNALFIENNHLNNARGTENDVGFGGLGGDRTVVRYNLSDNTSAIGIWNSHGTAWTGRDRGSRQKEVYRNTLNCVYSGGCGGGSYNSGTGYVFQNIYAATSPGFFNFYFSVDSPRVWRAVAAWGYCDGTGNYDTNDGTVYGTGTVSSSTGSSNFTDTTKAWTTNQWAPNGSPYAVHNVTQGFGGGLSSNTATTYTFAENGPFGQTWTTGNSYQILRASACLDQAGRSGGTLLAGTSGPNGGPTPTGANNQTLDPIYEAADTASGGFGSPVSSQTKSLIPNRDWYAESTNQTAQTSATSPFNGATGTGHGPRSLRPTTCTPGVAYFSTDQGTWNQSGDGKGSGVWDKCTGTNVWTDAAYVPATYPHPLITGVSQAATPTFTPGTGNYTTTQSVVIASTTPGNTINFTADGTTPTTSSPVYSGPVTVAGNTILQAITNAPGFTQSPVGSATYTFNVCASPTQQGPPQSFSGTYSAPVTAGWVEATPGCTIFITFDGSQPTSASTPYAGPYTISTTTTLRTIACGLPTLACSPLPSPGGTWTITGTQASTPVFAPGTSSSSSPITYTLSCASPSPTIYFTIDGSLPTTSSPVYSGPQVASTTINANAMCASAGLTNSNVASVTYTIAPTLAAPTLTPPGGIFGSLPTVAISGPAGANFCFTLDGSTPTAAGACTHGTLYTAPVAIPTNGTVLQALAWQAGHSNSSITSGTYTLTAPSSPVLHTGQQKLQGNVRITGVSYEIGNRSVHSYPGAGRRRSNLEPSPSLVDRRIWSAAELVGSRRQPSLCRV